MQTDSALDDAPADTLTTAVAASSPDSDDSRELVLMSKPSLTPDQPGAARQKLPVKDVVERISRMISVGELVPGQRLVEKDLMELFDAKRNSVREALRYLAGDGVVELLPNVGCRVRRRDSALFLEALEISGALFRAALERLAATPMPAAKKAAIKAQLDVIKAASLHGAGYEKEQALFHFLYKIYELCGNTHLLEVGNRLHSQHLNRQPAFAGFLADIDPYPIFKTLTERLMAGDAEGAYQTFRGQLGDRAAAFIAAEV